MVGIAVSVVVARALGPSGKGIYSLIFLVPSLLALVGGLGIDIANVYFGGKKKCGWADLASNSLVSALVLGILLAIAFLVYFLVFHPSFLKDIEPRYMSIAVLVVPFSLLATYFGSILLGQGRIGQYNILQVAPSLLSLVLVPILLLVFKGGVFSLIVAGVSTTLIVAIFSILLVRGAIKVAWSFHPRLFKDSLRFGVQGYLSNVIQFLNYRGNMFIIAYFMSVTFVGYYSIAVAMAESLWYFPNAVGTIIFARTPGLSADEANRSTPRICRNTFFITILAALALFGLSKYIIILFFGFTFLPALKPLWVLLPGIVALTIWKVLANEMAGRGKPLINAIGAGVSLAVNIPLNFWLIPEMGISGAALASTISYTVSAIVTLIVFLKVSRNNWLDTVILKRQDLSIYMVVISNVGKGMTAKWRSLSHGQKAEE